MKQFKFTLFTTCFLLLASLANSQTLIHYWNFNDNSTEEALLTPNEALVATPSITYTLGATSELAFSSGTGQDFDVNNFNARNGDEAGTHLRFNNPIGGSLEFTLPTTGFENIIVKFATRRSGSGAGTQYWSYTLDGTEYMLFDSIFPSSSAPELKTLDFRSIAEINNNPNFKIKVEFALGAGGEVGNNRFDNFTLESAADELPGAVTGVSLNKNDIILEVGNNETLVATVSPIDAIDNSVTWTSSDAATASVDINGVVTAVAAGNATIYVTTTDGGFMDSCSVMVTEPSGLDLIYYWHFNNFNPTADVTEIEVDYALINNSNAKLTYTLTPDPNVINERDIDRYSPGTLMNSQMGETAGGSARVRNPSVNRSLVFEVPTSGTKDIKMSLAVQRSGNGMLTNTIEYSIDGTNFITTDLENNIQNVEGAEVWQTHTYDFTGIAGVDNNPNFKIRIIWTDGNASNNSGNNRYDNITIMGVNVNVSVNDLVENSNKLNVFPNPSNGVLTVVNENGRNIQNVMVIDMSGRVVFESTQNTFELNHLNNGVYFIMTTIDNVTYKNKVILNK